MNRSAIVKALFMKDFAQLRMISTTASGDSVGEGLLKIRKHPFILICRVLSGKDTDNTLPMSDVSIAVVENSGKCHK